MDHQYESEPVHPQRDTHTVGAPKLVLGDAPAKGMFGRGLDSNTTYELHRGQAPQAAKEPTYAATPHASQPAAQPASRGPSYSSSTQDPSHLTPRYNVSGSTSPSGKSLADDIDAKYGGRKDPSAFQPLPTYKDKGTLDAPASSDMQSSRAADSTGPTAATANGGSSQGDYRAPDIRQPYKGKYDLSGDASELRSRHKSPYDSSRTDAYGSSVTGRDPPKSSYSGKPHTASRKKPFGNLGEQSDTLENAILVASCLFGLWLLYIILFRSPNWFVLSCTWWVGAALGGAWILASAGKT